MPINTNDLSQYKSIVGSGYISRLPMLMQTSEMLDFGRQLRDTNLWKYPILPGATYIFMQLASSREWSLSGKPQLVKKGMEFLNNAVTYDPFTGQTYYGFEQFTERRSLDYLTVGRTAMHVKRRGTKTHLEYIDPTYLLFNRQDIPRGINNSALDPVRPTEYVWEYHTRKFRADEVVIDHSLPIGYNLFLSPLSFVIPAAQLAWLVREHDNTALDGRKIRDIIFVGNASVMDAIEHAILQQVALASGASAQTVGIPVVQVANPQGQKISDQIHTMGISKIPEGFDRQIFVDEYVNQIATATGLSLRHFWNNEKTTNKALEEVQEARQQQKGPALFVRKEERNINNRGVLSHIGNSKNLRFAYIEEVDSASRKIDAEVLLQSATAMEKIKAVFGSGISLESYLAWMQVVANVPYSIELVEGADSNTSQDSGAVIESSASTTYSENPEVTVPSRDDPSTLKHIDYGEITMANNGEIIDRRVKLYRIEKTFNDLLKEATSEEIDFLKAHIDSVNENIVPILLKDTPSDDESLAVHVEYMRIKGE